MVETKNDFENNTQGNLFTYSINILILSGRATRSSAWFMARSSWIRYPIHKDWALPNLPLESGKPTFFLSLSVRPARWRSNFRRSDKKSPSSKMSVKKIWPMQSAGQYHTHIWQCICMVRKCTLTPKIKLICNLFILLVWVPLWKVSMSLMTMVPIQVVDTQSSKTGSCLNMLDTSWGNFWRFLHEYHRAALERKPCMWETMNTHSAYVKFRHSKDADIKLLIYIILTKLWYTSYLLLTSPWNYVLLPFWTKTVERSRTWRLNHSFLFILYKFATTKHACSCNSQLHASPSLWTHAWSKQVPLIKDI